MAEELPHEIVELGYLFSTYASPDVMGYRQFDLFLVEGDGASGFAPERVNFSVVEEGAALGTGDLTRQSGASSLQVAPGLVTVQANGGTQLEAYCFGGQFDVQRHATHTHCRLTSPAPILNLSDESGSSGENAALILVDELESELAILRAGTAEHADALATQLARVDPRRLYAAGLVLARDAFRQTPEILRTEHYWDEYGVLTRAIEAVQTEAWWPQDPSLTAVLAGV